MKYSYIDPVLSKGYTIDNEIYSIFSDIKNTFTDYEYAYNYIIGSAKEDIESTNEPGMHLIIEPIILPPIASAMFIAMYGELEGYLNLICKALKKNTTTKIKLNDLTGQGIERATTYLEKVIGIQNVRNNSDWQTLKHWNRIRNILVHNNSFIRQGKERDLDLDSTTYLKISVDEKNKVSLKMEDCERFNATIASFIHRCI